MNIRSIPILKAIFVSTWPCAGLLMGCISGGAYLDNPSVIEIIDKEALSEVNQIALLDVPGPSQINLNGCAVLFDAAVRKIWPGFAECDVTVGADFSEVTQNEMKNWLEKAGIEVITIEAKREKKAKILESYDQFEMVDADAILELAPISVGFNVDLREDKLFYNPRGPTVALIYRLVTPDNKVLIQSNVCYSSFLGGCFDLLQAGGMIEQQRGETRVFGPKELVFDDENGPRNQPEEAARRLRSAISKSTEAISRVITQTNEPVSLIRPSGEVDLSGVYTVTLSRKGRPDFSCFNQNRTFRMEIMQNAQVFEGRFMGKVQGKIEGSLHQDKVSFSYTTSVSRRKPRGECNPPIKGEWTIGSDGKTLVGYGWNEIKWTAEKIQ